MSEAFPSEPALTVAKDPEPYIEDFAELLRDLLRAVAADDNTEALSNASRRLRRLITYSEYLPRGLSWYKILDASVRKLKPPYTSFNAPGAYETDYDALARYGTKLAAELTTSDGFASARISKARRVIANEIKSIEEMRKLRREMRDSGLTT